MYESDRDGSCCTKIPQKCIFLITSLVEPIIYNLGYTDNHNMHQPCLGDKQSKQKCSMLQQNQSASTTRMLQEQNNIHAYILQRTCLNGADLLLVYCIWEGNLITIFLSTSLSLAERCSQFKGEDLSCSLLLNIALNSCSADGFCG